MRFTVYVVFFFFKQKTAYEMLISDWISDVCSSDLAAGKTVRFFLVGRKGRPVINRLFPGQIVEHYETTGIRDIGFDQAQEIAGKVRSEEHTSELQSLMRISYAVFCLKKKK